MNRAERRAQARGKRKQKSCRMEVRYHPGACPNCGFTTGGVYRHHCDHCGVSGTNCIACAPPGLREQLEQFWAQDRARIAAKTARLTAELNEAVGDNFRCADGIPEPILTALGLQSHCSGHDHHDHDHVGI